MNTKSRQSAISACPTPILDALIASGSVYSDDEYTYTGIASDGTHCTLPGGIKRPDLTERYLTDYPIPEDW